MVQYAGLAFRFRDGDADQLFGYITGTAAERVTQHLDFTNHSLVQVHLNLEQGPAKVVSEFGDGAIKVLRYLGAHVVGFARQRAKEFPMAFVVMLNAL